MAKNSIAVFGFGKTGKALLDFLIKSEYTDIYLYNDKGLDLNNDKIKVYIENNIKVCFGEEGFEKIGQNVKTVVLSPGFNSKEERFDGLREKGIKIISEIEFAFSFIDADKTKIIALTGTNGKSTTVSLIYHFLKENGYNTVLAGNIGVPFISEIERIKKFSDKSFVVLELSSFQLEDIEDFKPYISLILNITPDHLDRYGEMGKYINAKLNILKNCDEKAHFIFNSSDNTLNELRNNCINRYSFALNDSNANAYLNGDSIGYDFVINSKHLIGDISLENNPLSGVHNLENILAAVLTALIIGLEPIEIKKSLKTFKGLEHRMESAGKINGVEFINDSKATNIDATIKSSKSFNEDMVVILGGKDKGSSFKPLDKILSKRAKGILLIGDAKQKIYDDLENCKDKMKFVDDFKEAILSGYKILKDKGGIVLLAPACTSFDMFDNFEARGRNFKMFVEQFIENIKEKKNG